jgi:hypothetical protein
VLDFVVNGIKFKEPTRLSRDPNSTFFKNDIITAINGQSLKRQSLQARGIQSLDLNTFKELTEGNPGDVITFNVTNSTVQKSQKERTVEITLKAPSEPLPEVKRMNPDQGGYGGRGLGKKKTSLHKKHVIRRNCSKNKHTKKRKVMAGGVNPPQPSERPKGFVRTNKSTPYTVPDPPVEVFDVPNPSNMEDSRTVICDCVKSNTSE